MSGSKRRQRREARGGEDGILVPLLRQDLCGRPLLRPAEVVLEVLEAGGPEPARQAAPAKPRRAQPRPVYPADQLSVKPRIKDVRGQTVYVTDRKGAKK